MLKNSYLRGKGKTEPVRVEIVEVRVGGAGVGGARRLTRAVVRVGVASDVQEIGESLPPKLVGGAPWAGGLRLAVLLVDVLLLLVQVTPVERRRSVSP